MSSSWVVQNLSPNTVNVLADLAGMLILAVFMLGLNFLYPYLVWDSVKSGKPVPMDGILDPPTLWQSIIGFTWKNPRPWPSLWLIWGMPLILLVANFAHTCADIYLDFVSVRVDSREAFLLSENPIPVVSTLSLLAPEFPSQCVPRTYPISGSEADIRLLREADKIASGVGRFSIFPPIEVKTHEQFPILGGLVNVIKSYLYVQDYLASAGSSDEIHPPRRIPLQNLNVECQAPQQLYSMPYEPQENDTGWREYYTEYNALQYHFNTYVSVESNNAAQTDAFVYFISIPECDYETLVEPETIQDTEIPRMDGLAVSERNKVDSSWTVVDWSQYLWGPLRDTGVDFESFGALNKKGELRWYMDLSYNETQLSCLRDGSNDVWGLGRALDDGITLAMGLDTNDNATHWNWFEPYLPHKEGYVEFQVNHSVLSGPGERNPFDDRNQYYTISSWSKNCPVVELDGNVTVESFPEVSSSVDDGASPSGCVIDTVITCFGLLPQDVANQSATNNNEMPLCRPVLMSVTLLEGIEVDRAMLAAYTGIATRNRAMNIVVGNVFARHQVAINSLAAAYIVTRQIVPGTLAVEGVRASLSKEFWIFMALPLVCIVPFFFIVAKTATATSNKSQQNTPQIVTSLWQVLLVLGRQETTVFPQSSREGRTQMESDEGDSSNRESFPGMPSGVKYGLTRVRGSLEPQLGLGKSNFVSLADSKNNQRKNKKTLPEQPHEKSAEVDSGADEGGKQEDKNDGADNKRADNDGADDASVYDA